MRVSLREELGNTKIWVNMPYSAGMSIEWWHWGRYCEACGSEIETDNIKPANPAAFLDKLQRECRDSKKFSAAHKACLDLSFTFTRNLVDFRKLTVCPVCGEKLQYGNTAPKGFYAEMRGNDQYYSGLHVDKMFTDMREARFESYQAEADKKAYSLLETYEDMTFDDTVYPKSTDICENNGKLRDYLNHLLKLETSIYALRLRLALLYGEERIFVEKRRLNQSAKIDEANRKLKKAERNLANLCKVDGSENVEVERIKNPAPPVAPIKPKLTLSRPVEPQYGVPGLFNKKKVLAQNEELRATYLEKLNAYDNECTQYQRALEKFDIAYAEYSTKYSEYKASCERNRNLEKEKYEDAVRMARSIHNEKIETAKKEVELCKKELDDVKAQTLSTSDNILSDEIDMAEKALQETVVCKNQLYSQNVIFPKYRNLVAIASLNEYIMSGRSNSLTGSGGAYDKFEMDCRADRIISQLSEVVTSLDAIREGQHMLYTQITAVNKGLDKLNKTTEDALNVLTKMDADMYEQTRILNKNVEGLSKKADSIVKNTDIIAYNTAMTAFYTKKNTELTDALGFLVALK